MSLKLIEDYPAAKFAVFEHSTGKGVIAQTAYNGAKNNAAVYDSVGEAINTSLAVAWGKPLQLTHRIKLTVIKEALSANQTESEGA